MTNLNDSGAGSLRQCVNMEGPRTVIFEVGGTIELNSRLIISNPYITIAGQTAPGGGIQISGKNIDRDVVTVNTHEVILRYLRIRKGRSGSGASAASITNTSGGNPRNVIFDHLSIFWGEDQNLGVWGWGAKTAPRSITIQNSILAEVLSGHSTSLLTGSSDRGTAEQMTDIDFHNNLLANTNHRNPLLKHGSGRFVNNIVYNWSYYATNIGSGPIMDFVGNLYKLGPTQKNRNRLAEIMVFPYREELVTETRFTGYIDRTPSVFVSGNKGPWFTTPDLDNWPMVKEIERENSPIMGPAPKEWQRTAPLPVAGIAIKVRRVEDLEEVLLPAVGASKRLDCFGDWVSNRDDADERLISGYYNNDGYTPVDHEADVGGFPTLSAGAPCADTSGDGIPDAWAMKNGLDYTDPSMGARTHATGYTHLELYLNGMRLGLAPASEPTNIRVQ